MTFAQKLRELRDAKGLSEAKLAEASGVSFGAIHIYGMGRSKPSFENVLALAKALGVTCEAFSECEDVQPDRAEDVPAKVAKPAAKKPTPKKK